MVNNKGKKKRSKKRGASQQHLPSSVADSFDYFDESIYYARLGCHIANVARCRVEAMRKSPWLLGVETFDPNDYEPDDIQHIPDIAMNDGEEDECGDTSEMSLTLTNVEDTTKIYFLTVYDVDLCGADGKTLSSGWACKTNSNNVTTQRKCTTFIILCPPETFVHLVTLVPNQTIGTGAFITSWSQIEIESDVQQWSFHPNVKDEHPSLLHFPFHDGKEEEEAEEEARSTKSFQCIQAENGNLTHFFHGNFHAIDFSCPLGTPLYSATNGLVVEVKDNGGVGRHHNQTNNPDGEECDEIIEVSGIAASNLFHWNSIMIQSTDVDSSSPLYIEYVHIQTNSCTVKVGDIVKRGQFLCQSGSVGFSPEPHLHFAAYRSNADDAATVRVKFQSSSNNGNSTNETIVDEGHSFLPRVGQWYNHMGRVQRKFEKK